MTGKKDFIDWFKANQYQKMTADSVIKKLLECYDGRLNINDLEMEIERNRQEQVAMNRSKAIAIDFFGSNCETKNYVVEGGTVEITKDGKFGYMVMFYYTIGDQSGRVVKCNVTIGELANAIYSLIYDWYVDAA